MMEQCLFCNIASGKVPAKIVYDSKDVMAFLDIRPANPGHVLVIPKTHVELLPDLPEELNSVLMQVVKIVAQAQIEALGAQGVNVLQNNGQIAGQAVPHVHVHLIPRFKDDKVVLNWDSLELKREQFDEVQKLLISKAKELASGMSEEPAHKKEVQETPKEPEPELPKGKTKLLKVKPRIP